jgi:ribosomal protein S18 acetylase RimI-like enzyme
MSESLNETTLRPATADDDTFLFLLYASTRDEFSLLNWDEEQKQALIKMQYDARRSQYEESYTRPEDNIIVAGEMPVGRLFVNEIDREITLVDIALVPKYRNLGIGATLIRQLLDRAVKAGKPVRLHVLKTNPAQHLYQRLGFSQTGEASMYLEMTFEP